jgi:hypothetical protein
MPRQQKPLPARSSRQVATSKAISAACPLTGTYCSCCGSSYNLSRSHALTRKQFPQHAANPNNMLVLCWDHHMLFEHSKPAFAREWPAVWARKVGMMRALEPSYCAFMLEKLKLHPAPGASPTI